MPFGGLLTMGAGIVGAGSALGGLFGGPGGAPQPVPSQVPTYGFQNQPGADQGAFTGTQNLGGYNIGANFLPQYQAIVNSQLPQNNPYANQYLQNIGAVGQAGMGSGASVLNTSLSALPNVQALMQLGFDPQNSLYQQLQNQNQQQNAAILGNSGVAQTPYGAGVQQQANTNFNIDWQNNLLGRATQASGAAGNLLGSAGQGVGTGLQQMTQGAGAPYSAYTGINTDALSAISGAGGFGQTASSIPQTQIQDYLSYLSGGQGAQSLGLQEAQQQFNQEQTGFLDNQLLGKNLGAGLAQIGTGWGKAFGGGGGTGNFNTMSTPWGSMPMAA